jgi:hypothetical protein
MRTWRRGVVLLSVIAILAFPATAFAGGTTPNDDQYPTNVDSSGPGGEVNGVNGSNDVAPVQSSGSLPFTGFQAAVVLLAGGGVLGAGLVLRRLGRPGEKEA